MSASFVGLARLAAVGAALALGACAADIESRIDTRGNWVRASQIEKVMSGGQTRAEVLELLGTPSSISTFDDQTWYYIGRVTVRQLFFHPTVVDQQVLAVHFDEAGRVAAVDQLGVDKARDIAFVERQTATTGHSEGVIQQLLGNIGRFSAEDYRSRR
ncbi:MAG: outer membrane protein assembly factor BamE [Proteobacteria bacterium]|nr:outer membrane protein assembly factor BamE [Pseudomonadota bacterium]